MLLINLCVVYIERGCIGSRIILSNIAETEILHRVVTSGPMLTCMGKSLMIGIHPLDTLTQKYAVNPHLIMSFPIDGFEDLQWNPVLMRDVLDEHPSLPMNGQSMHLGGQGAHFNVFPLRAHCISLLSAMRVAL